MKKIFISTIALLLLLTSCKDKSSNNTTSIISGKWKIESADGQKAPDANAHLIIDGQKGRCNGSTGCNFYGATIIADSIKQTLVLSQLYSTEIGCANELSVFESNYYNALQSIDGFSVDATTLLLKEGDKSRIVLKK